MRALILLPLLSLALPACAASQQSARVETGYEVGALGLAAIDRGDWEAAERQLNAQRGVTADDPARLINLGRVYAATGRPELAAASWQQALNAPHHYQVTLGDGTVASTDEVARAALARYSFAARN
ncbi:hypothetical protein SAMN06295912_13326 [Sphingomonas laterariae]|uniref:Tetratricopeptide repeat-containing protein n=1 Tax=Edaphosphingomonas laterariae TaxID=861865 RepID=A0A239JDN0_9SPHN|nr:hypothetical protein [Sphingomonas laterariae]SNT03899.1 hypothetical protein SAMN06295912_13326 [Sphingomonas laterariae]